ncbi:MAG: alpha/beta fold hydrolase [Pikeienuella sp.]
MSRLNWAEPLAPGAVRPDAVLALVAEDGRRLRGALWKGGGRGLAVLLPGRAEFLEKTALFATRLAARGFVVASLDWRGQGRSERVVVPVSKGHVGDFSEYLLDLRALLTASELAEFGPPRLVAGHSMGGAIAALATAEGLARAPLLLSAPMFGIRIAPLQRRIAQTLAWIAHQGGRSEAWPPVSRARAARAYPLHAAFEGNFLVVDRAVWDWMRDLMRREPEIAIGLPSLGWLLAAERAMRRAMRLGPLGVPGLAVIGSMERVVSPRALAGAARRLGFETVEVAGGRHEPLIDVGAVSDPAWAAIDRFLAREGI